MKRAMPLLVVLALAAFLAAQQSSTAPKTSDSSSTGSAQAPAAAPAGKRPPQAKTQAEFDAYQAAVANAKDPAAMEKAADDFATKFPNSELRVLLYRITMHGYQSANNADKTSELGRKVLGLDPDDPEALLAVAGVIAERTRDTDLDKNERYDEALKMAQHSLETIDSDIAVPAGTPQDKVDAYKGYLRSSAFAVIGAIQYAQEKYPDAESSLRKSIDAFPAQPDPVAVLRLSLALDKQDKYPEALKYANQAVQITQENTSVGAAARHEQSRLTQLTGGAAPAANPPAGAAPNPAPPNH